MPPTGPAVVPPLPKGEHEQLDASGGNQVIGGVIGPQSVTVNEKSGLLSDPDLHHANAFVLTGFHIESGTHITVRIASLEQRRDGSFSFQGSLTKPLRQGGTRLFPEGSLVSGRSVPPTKGLTIQTLQMPGDLGLQYSDSPRTQYVFQGSRANAATSRKSGRTLSEGETVELEFVLRSEYQIQPSP